MIDIYARVGVQAQPEEHLVSIGAHAGFAKAAVFQGTSAYQVLTDGVRINGGPEAALPKPATEIPGCHALYKCSAHPALDPAAALLDADRLVSAHSLVPGLTRLDSTGKATLAIAQGQRTMLDLQPLVRLDVTMWRQTITPSAPWAMGAPPMLKSATSR